MFSVIFANLCLVVAVFGFGSFLRPLVPSTFRRTDRLALALLGGIGACGTLLFLVGQLWFSRAAIILMLLPGVLYGVCVLLPKMRRLRANSTLTAQPVIPVFIVIVVLLITAIGGFAEPTGDIKMDAIAYHFLGPKVWLRQGMIRPVLDESVTSFPALVETQFAALMVMGGQRAPGLFALLALTAMLLLAVGLARRMGLDAAGAWWVAALITTMPALYRGAFGGFNDVVYSGLVLAAARVVFDAESPGHYALFGIFCGFAMGAKYTGVLATAILFLCALLIAFANQRDQMMSTLKYLVVAGLIAVALASPWYARNWILMGCPIYPPPPLLPRFFHIRYFPPEAVQEFHRQMLLEGRGMGINLLSLFLLPFHLTYHPANFMNGAGGIGIVPLALGPFGLFECRCNRFVKSLGLFALVQTIVWFATMQESRYLIHVYAIAAIFGVCGWRYVVRVTRSIGRALSGAVVATSVLYGMFMIGSARIDDVRAAVSNSFNEKRRSAEIPYLDSFRYLNKESSVTKVLILAPPVPPYYLDKNYVKPVGRRGEETIPDARNLEQVLAEVRRLDVSHVLDVRSAETPFRLSDPPRNLTLVFERKDQRVYRVD